MAKNDRVLLDGIVDDRIAAKLPSEKRDEAFEYLAVEQSLKDFDLSHDEIMSGLIDGRQDGGMDGFFILVNGHLLQDPEAFVWPRTNAELRVVLITCKHHETFKQATLDGLIATLTELLDFSIEDGSLRGAYSQLLLKMRNNLRFAYRKLSPRLTNFVVDAIYASRGDTADLGSEVLARGGQIEKLVSDYFGTSQATLTFLGSSELVALHRKIPNYTLVLPFVEALAKGERYVILARLSDYFRFVSDQGKLRRYLFESNVRDFMGLNRVNEDIKATLENTNSPDFWWLNNGVTILATAATITGKLIQMTDIQIVNGLQTTESIHRHFMAHSEREDDRCVLVKVIVSKEEEFRDTIIRATNNQTSVELASLHATDKIQRDIEEVLLRHGLYYERRKNFYVNQGHAIGDIVTPLYAAAGYVALILKMPHRAATLRARFMRSPASYEAVFSERTNIEAWPKICALLKRVDAELETLRPNAKWSEKFLKGWRYMIALILVAESLKKFSFSASEIAGLDLGIVTSQRVKDIWLELAAIGTSSNLKGGWTTRKDIIRACAKFATTRRIADVEVLDRPEIPLADSAKSERAGVPVVPDELVERVKTILPAQPWKPGLHRKLASELGCSVNEYFGAVDRLIEDGLVYRQKDGVLYDLDGNVVGIDHERVDPKTLTLRPAV